jgi:L-seryl-tRNA(Ser) seleniumtransferase
LHKKTHFGFTAASADTGYGHLPSHELLFAVTADGAIVLDTGPWREIESMIREEPMRTHGPNRLQIISMTMQPGEELIVGNTLRQILEKARKSAAA